MPHQEKLDPGRSSRMILPPDESGLFASPIDPDLDRDLNNQWIVHALNRFTGQMGTLHKIVLRNQWWLLTALAVETGLVLMLAAMVWSMSAAR